MVQRFKTGLEIDLTQPAAEFDRLVERMRTRAIQAGKIPAAAVPSAGVRPRTGRIRGDDFARQFGFQQAALAQQIRVEKGVTPSVASRQAGLKESSADFRSTLVARGATPDEIQRLDKVREQTRLATGKQTAGITEAAALQEELNRISNAEIGIKREKVSEGAKSVVSEKTNRAATQRLSEEERQLKRLNTRNANLRRELGDAPRDAPGTDVKGLREENVLLQKRRTEAERKITTEAEREAARIRTERAASRPSRLNDEERQLQRLNRRNADLRREVGDEARPTPGTDVKALRDENVLLQKRRVEASRKITTLEEQEAARLASERGNRVRLTPEQRNIRDLNDTRNVRRANLGLPAATSSSLDPQALQEENAALLGQQQAANQIKASEARKQAALATKQSIQQEAEIAVEQQILTERRRTLEIESAQRPQLVQARAQRIIAERQAAGQLQKEIAVQAKQQGVGFLTRQQLRFGGGAGGGTQAGTGIGNFLGGGLATTLRFAIPSAALFGTVRGVKGLIDEGKELELVFNRITAQFEQLNSQDDLRGQFDETALERFQEGIVAISRETGVAADVVGDLAESFVGLFVDQGPDTGIALTNLAVQLAVITDLEPEEAFNDLGAALRAFVSEGDDVVKVGTQISDTVIAIRNATGVAGDELTDFVSRVAALGAESGGSLQQLTALGATIQQASGVGGAALAEQFGRILSGFSGGVGLEIFELADQIDGLDIDPEAVNGGQAIPVLISLIEQYDTLNDAQRNQIRTQLGGRREGATLQALFTNSATALRLLNEELIQGGEAQADFNRRQETLSQQLAQLGAAFQEFGVRLFEAGLSDLLIGFVNALELLVTIGESTVIPVLEKIAEIIGGLPGGFTTAAVAAVALTAAFRGTGQIPGQIAGQQVVGGIARNGAAIPQATGIDRGFAPLRSTGSIGGSGLAQGLAVSGAVFAAGKLFDEITQFNASAEQGIEQLRKNLTDFSQEQLQLELEANAAAADSRGFFEKFAGNLLRLEDVDAAKQQTTQNEIASRAAAGGQKLLADLQSISDEAFQAFIDAASERDFIGVNNIAEGNLKVVEFFAEQGLLEGGAFDLGDRLGDGIGFNPDFDSLPQFDPGNLTPELVATLTDAVEGQYGPEIQEAATAIFASLRDLPVLFNDEIPQIVQDAIDQAVQNDTDAAEFEAFDLDLVRAQFDTGQIGVQGLLDGIDQQIKAIQGLVDAENPDAEVLAEYLKLRQEGTELIASVIQNTFDTNERLLGFANDAEAATPEAQIARLETLIGELSDAGDFAGAGAAAEEIFKLQQQGVADLAAQAGSSAEALAIIAAGDPANTTAQLASVRSRLADARDAFTDYATTLLRDGIELTDNLLDVLAGNIVAAGDAAQGLQDFIAQRLGQLRAVAELTASFGGSTSFQTDQIAFLEGLQVEDDAPTFSPLENITDNGQQKALAEKAAKDAADLAKEIQDARFELLEALYGGDPVRAAQIAQDKARAQIAKAENEAERLRGQAALVKADRSLEEAIRDITEAQGELALAFAEYAGNAIEATQISLEEARRRLQETQRDFENGNAGQADVLRAEADVVRAEAAARDEQLNSQLADFQFMFDMEQITKTQFIAYLQSLKQIPDLTTEQIRDIDRQIKSLRDEVQSDLQFNLPTNFALPTLYEARRVNNGTGGGVGYQDNRNVNVTLVVNNGMSQQEASDFLFDALGGGPVTSANRRF